MSVQFQHTVNMVMMMMMMMIIHIVLVRRLNAIATTLMITKKSSNLLHPILIETRGIHLIAIILLIIAWTMKSMTILFQHIGNMMITMTMLVRILLVSLNAVITLMMARKSWNVTIIQTVEKARKETTTAAMMVEVMTTITLWKMLKWRC